MLMKIYTKTGDKGQTSLLGGARVPKSDLRIEAYGTVDELNSWIGLLRDQEVDETSRTTLIEVQDRLFTMGSLLATQPGKDNVKIPKLADADVEFLEKEIDRMNETLPEMRSFVLPGGHTTVSYCHLARTVCRRAERRTIELGADGSVPDLVVRYLNRLSDYLFVLSRKFTMDLNAEEIPWQPRM